MTPFTDLARRQTLVELCAQRDRCQSLVEHAQKALDDAGKLLPTRYGLSVEIEHCRRTDEVAREIDRQFWRHALDLTGFRQVMDAKALSDWLDDVKGPKCPAFTEDTVIATFLAAAQNAGDLFDRGVYRVFRALDSHYRSNERDAFKVVANQRYVLAFWVDNWSGRKVSYRRLDSLNDVDRVVRTVRGETFTARALESAMNAAFQAGEDYECEVYKARAFANGNLHLWIKDAAAVDAINEAIARHAGGNAIPRERAA